MKLAAVEGLRSWVGEGWRFREADWRVEARVRAGLEDIFGVVWGAGGRWVEVWRVWLCRVEGFFGGFGRAE